MRRTIEVLSAFAVAVAGTLISQPARAQCGTVCTDASGVVNLPAGAGLSLPFKQGENVKILSGYGPNAGSSLHCRTQDGGCANDYFALDLILPDHPSSGKGQPVLAAASGKVIAAGWGSEGWVMYGQRVYIQHDFGDGHSYTTLYAHLDSINVSAGENVNKGDVIGALGQSCNNALSCSNFSTPHVHFSLHRDSSFGGTGSGGSYAGRAVRPEPIDGVTGIQQGQTHLSQNGQTTTPPPSCDVIPPTGTLIEDDTECVTKGGQLDETTQGLGGHAYYSTLDTPDPDYAEGAFWLMNYAQAGNYDLFAWIPTGLSNLTSEAIYKVQFNGSAQKVKINQAATAGDWAHLGTFPFAAGENQWVRLGDNYASAESQGKTFVIDAIKVAPGGGSSGSSWGGSSGGPGSGWSGTTGSGGSSSSLPDGEIDSSGCACRAGGREDSNRHGLFSAALALALALGRRRLSASRTARSKSESTP